MKRIKILSAILLACAALAPVVSAGSFKMRWVETELLLDRDGKAQVSYAVRWNSDNAQLHGFYFEGLQETPVFDLEKSYALDDAGTRYPLEIKKLSDRKYDIVLGGWEPLAAQPERSFFTGLVGSIFGQIGNFGSPELVYEPGAPARWISWWCASALPALPAITPPPRRP